MSDSKTKKTKLKIRVKKPRQPKISPPQPKASTLDSLVQSFSQCDDAKITDDSFGERVEMDTWVLDDKKDFFNFVGEFEEEVQVYNGNISGVKIYFL